MENLFPYLPYATVMSPSIGIAIVYLIALMIIAVYFDIEDSTDLERLATFFFFSLAFFAISVSIGNVIKAEAPTLNIPSTAYNITIHEEFLIAIVVEMVGAMIFVPPIYGSDKQPPGIYQSLIFSLIFIAIFFILPLFALVNMVPNTSPDIALNYIDNLRVELVSIIAIFFIYTIGRIGFLDERREKMQRLQQLFIMFIIIVLAIIFIQQTLLEPEYENIFLALGVAIMTTFVIAIAKIIDNSIYGLIVIAIITSIYLLTGTQIPDFPINPPLSINLTAEFIGAITVALILDSTQLS